MLFDRLWTREKDRAKLIDWRRHRLCLLLGGFFRQLVKDEVAVYAVDTVELIAGTLPRRQQRFVEAWAELHQKELLEDWGRLQSGHPPLPIDPLH